MSSLFLIPLFLLISSCYSSPSTLHDQKFANFSFMSISLIFVPPDLHLSSLSSRLIKGECEACYRIQSSSSCPLDHDKLAFLLSSEPWANSLSTNSRLRGRIVEIGPHEWQCSSFCSNALSVLHSSGFTSITRIEKYRRFAIPSSDARTDDELLKLLGDPMTESIVREQKITFSSPRQRKPFVVIDVLSSEEALLEVNERLGLALDKEDIEYYNNLYRNILKRNPTDVELSDLANGDSEHSRHWFFRGRLIRDDGKEVEGSLMDRIKRSLEYSNKNNLIAFSDNSSAIRGFDDLPVLLPSSPSTASPLLPSLKTRHIVYTAETHNFPTAVCPFEGAATGVGGRMRDSHSTGRGSYETAGVAGYSFGSLNLPGYPLPWESQEEYPSSFALPKDVAIGASNGASDYGNKFGEPVICGFSRSFGMRMNGRRIEYLKPIMFSGGIGSIDEENAKKTPCEEGMLVAKIGGPAYRIGVGGGAASSVVTQGSRKDGFDFSAVQRGDAQAGHKLHRLVRACAEMGGENPIQSIHDQGAGGNGNVLKEIVEGCGAVIEADAFPLGDESLSMRELWTAEYQENDAILVCEKDVDTLRSISIRENCPFSVVGRTTKDRRFVVKDFADSRSKVLPVDFPLDVLEQRPKKMFGLKSSPVSPSTSSFEGVSVKAALSRVLRLPSVASKRYLTSKVDRSVSGLIAQQQCVGPLQTPLADVAVVALSHLDHRGSAVSVGEQPVKMLVDTKKGVESTLAEALTNIVSAPITDIRDIKMSGNWMWSREGDGGRLVDAVVHLCEAMKEVGVAIDGGKDSLSMRAATSQGIVTAPGTLVLSAYAPCTDIRLVVTPDLKESKEETVVVYVRMDGGTQEDIGGSALGQVFSSLGGSVAGVTSWSVFSSVFSLIQSLLNRRLLLASHDVSDGGTLVSLLEMAFAGNISIEAEFHAERDALTSLFAENSAVLLQMKRDDWELVKGDFQQITVAHPIATVGKDMGPNANVMVQLNGKTVLEERLVDLREEWEETSDRLDLLQTDASCVEEARNMRRRVERMEYTSSFSYSLPSSRPSSPPLVIILRDEGSNGDREMAASFYMAGLSPLDVTINDLLIDTTLLSKARGIAFVGGFSFSDVLGSAKGWAARIKLHEELSQAMERFQRREDTFSLGVCNGCQLMALLGWVGEYEGRPSVVLEQNKSGKFESTFSSVQVESTNSIFTKGMEGSVIGIWSAHGEGRFVFRSPEARSSLSPSIAFHYVDESSSPTQEYPFNPSGSAYGVAGISSSDGRHLALMPHPERSFLGWQNPCGEKSGPSPPFRLFLNAAEWAMREE